MDKYIVLPKDISDEIDSEILEALEYVPDLKISDQTPISLEVEIGQEYVDILREHLQKLGASLHETEAPTLMEPMRPRLDDLKKSATKIRRRKIK